MFNINKMDAHLKSLLESANAQIRQLRRSNELMSAKLDMFDSMKQLINIDRPSGYSMAEGYPDVTHEIDKYIAASGTDLKSDDLVGTSNSPES